MLAPLRLFALVSLVPLVAGCVAGCGGSGGNAYETATEDCVNTINAYRKTLGLAAYTRWTVEESCVDSQAQADSNSGTPHSAFGRCGESAQNECPGWPGPPETMITQCLAQMWAEGPGTDFSAHGHYINMSSTSYTQVACGFYVKSDMTVWATQNFK